MTKQNCCYWSDKNPHVFREKHTQFLQENNIWADISGDAIIVQLFIQGNLNGEMYTMCKRNLHNRKMWEIDEDGKYNIRQFWRNKP